MRSLRYLLPLAAIAALVVFLPADLYAQIPKFDAATTTLKTQAKAVIRFARFLIAAAAALMGFWQGFKAAKGDNKGWVATILLFMIAAIAVSPRSAFDLFGMNELCSGITGWGICD